MHPSKSMSRVVGGKRYAVATSKLIADDERWDGSNWERHCRNTFLYKTKGGAFFRVDLTQWQGERDTIEPLDIDEAKALYEYLDDPDAIPYEEAFDEVVEDASAGRPTFFGEPMKQVSVYLPETMIAWLKDQPGGMGESIRNLIKKEMENK